MFTLLLMTKELALRAQDLFCTTPQKNESTDTEVVILSRCFIALRRFSPKHSIRAVWDIQSVHNISQTNVYIEFALRYQALFYTPPQKMKVPIPRLFFCLAVPTLYGAFHLKRLVTSLGHPANFILLIFVDLDV